MNKTIGILAIFMMALVVFGAVAVQAKEKLIPKEAPQEKNDNKLKNLPPTKVNDKGENNNNKVTPITPTVNQPGQKNNNKPINGKR